MQILTQLSTSICVRARVIAAAAAVPFFLRARDRDRDGEHLIAACNADEGGDQALDEVLAVAPFLVLRRYLILNLS